MDLVKAVVRPGSVDEVVALVRQARASRQPLYPVSRGMNWGYGGATPPQPGCTVVDLSGMDRIRNASDITAANPVAVIEPGVTQRQLYDHLCAHAPSLMFNVTGSAASTSLIGCALDRGVGYAGPRIDDIFGLEVVLGTGDIIHTGFRRLGDDSPLAYSHPHGLGPISDGLFSQGNFGIVTSACFRLLRKRPVEMTLSLGLRDERRLGEFLVRLVELKRDGLLTSVTHVGNAARAGTTLRAGIAGYLSKRCGVSEPALSQEADAAVAVVAGTPWTGVVGLAGSRAQARAALSEIRARLKGLAEVRTFSAGLLSLGAKFTDRFRALPLARRYAAALAAILPLQELALGKPTDIAFQNLLSMYGQPELSASEFEASRCGVLFVSPALPMDGRFIARFVAELRQIAERFGHQLYITINIETANSIVGIINLLFDKTQPEQMARAHACAEAMFTHVRDNGLEVYRARIDQMPAVVGRNPAHWALLKRLKDAWDPDGVIAPGRYCVESSSV